MHQFFPFWPSHHVTAWGLDACGHFFSGAAVLFLVGDGCAGSVRVHPTSWHNSSLSRQNLKSRIAVFLGQNMYRSHVSIPLRGQRGRVRGHRFLCFFYSRGRCQTSRAKVGALSHGAELCHSRAISPLYHHLASRFVVMIYGTESFYFGVVGHGTSSGSKDGFLTFKDINMKFWQKKAKLKNVCLRLGRRKHVLGDRCRLVSPTPTTFNGTCTNTRGAGNRLN